MEYKKNHKIKLTKFGKKFFAFTIVLIIGISVLCLNNSNRNLKEETNNYLVEINYPKVNNKDLLAYVKEYLQNKEEEFKNDISDLENMNSSKYEFKTDYKISENEDVLGVHLMLMYGKEASNRKQEIDRQHYTIPNQRPKDKHCGKI